MRGQPDRSGNKPAKTESGGNIILLHSPPNFFSPIKSSYCLKLPVSQLAKVQDDAECMSHTRDTEEERREEHESRQRNGNWTTKTSINR